MEKVKKFVPSIEDVISFLILLILVNATLELVGGLFAGIVMRPVSTIKALIGQGSARNG